MISSKYTWFQRFMTALCDNLMNHRFPLMPLIFVWNCPYSLVYELVIFFCRIWISYLSIEYRSQSSNLNKMLCENNLERGIVGEPQRVFYGFRLDSNKSLPFGSNVGRSTIKAGNSSSKNVFWSIFMLLRLLLLRVSSLWMTQKRASPNNKPHNVCWWTVKVANGLNLK